jgi:hypothetical protein
MNGQACPLLGSLSEQGVHLNYPNFENRCYVTGQSEAVPLAQQQFFCLGGQYATCPRYSLATTGKPVVAPPAAVAAAPVPAWVEEAETWESVTTDEPSARSSWTPFLLGAGGVVVVAVLCLALLGSVAVLRVWSNRTQATEPTPVVAVPAIILPTATPTAAPPTPLPTNTVDPQVAAAFATVTAIAQAGGTQPTLPFSLTPRPTPTRRPFPEEGTEIPPLDTPTPTGQPGVVPTPTPDGTFEPTWTPTATQPAVPVISFSAAPQTILIGSCATLRWSAVGVEALYLTVDGVETGVTGTGSQQVCPMATTDYILRVVLRDLSMQEWVATVQVRGTPTPTVTPTFTWTPDWTATFTPTSEPTATPTSTPQYGVRINGENRSVQVAADGTEHEITSYGVQNMGNTVDTLRLTLSGDVPGGGRLLLCIDNVCYTDNVAEASFGAGAVKNAQIRVSVPGGTAAGASSTLQLQVASNSDASQVSSVQVVVTVQ